MNDDFNLEQRLHHLLPAEVPGELQRRLRAAEPSARPGPLGLRLPGLLVASLRPWPLAYAGLGAVWAIILCLHLSTQAPPPTAGNTAVARSSDEQPDSSPFALTTGLAPERAILLSQTTPTLFGDDL